MRFQSKANFVRYGRFMNALPILVFVVLSGSTLMTWAATESVRTERLRSDTSHAAEQTRHQLQTWLDHRVALIRHMGTHAESPEQFNEFAFEFMDTFPGFVAINWMDTSFTIKSIAPPDTNQEALGKCLLEHPDPRVHDAVLRAEQTKSIQCTLVEALYQGGRGFVIYAPALGEDGVISGYVNGVFQVDEILRTAVASAAPGHRFLVSLQMVDNGQSVAEIVNPYDAPVMTAEIRVLDQSWRLMVTPSPQVMARHHSMVDETIMIVLILFSAFVAWQIAQWTAHSRQLRESLAFTDGLVNAVPQIVHTYDCRANRFTFLSDRLATSLGLNQARRIRDADGFLEPFVHADDRFAIGRMLDAADDGNDSETIEAEFRMQHSDGEWRWFRTRNSVLNSVHDGSQILLGTTEDITEEKRVLEELRDRASYQRLFTDLSARFINVAAENMNLEISSALQTLGEFTGADRCFISVFREGTRVVDYTLEWRAPRIPVTADRTAGMDVSSLTWSSRIVEERGYLCIERVADLPPEAEMERRLLEAEGTKSAVNVPVYCHNDIVGYLGLDSVRAERSWPSYVIDQLCTVGQVFGNAIDRKQNAESLQYRVDFENLITYISTNFVNITPEEFESELQRALQLLGEFGNADRCYVVFYLAGPGRPSHAFEWCREGVHAFREDALQRPGADYPWGLSFLRSGKHIEVTNRNELPPEASAERLLMEHEGTQSMLVVPLRLRKKLCGFLGFDSVFTQRAWPDDTASLLRIVGEVFSSAAERQRAEVERLQLEKQVQHAQKLESLGILAGGIAHDFNNLLVGVLGNADLALMDLLPGTPARESVGQIIVAAKRAADLTQQMLAYSGRGAFVVQPTNLNGIVREMTQLVDASVSKKANLRFDLAENLPLIKADTTQLHQIAMNLIINASDALMDRPGDINVSTGVFRIEQTMPAGITGARKLEPGDYVFLEVSDTGLGMDAETRQRIFDPFFTTKFTGRGLGLAAVMGIVQGHRGAIIVRSEPGEGTVFRVLFPACDADHREPQSKAETSIQHPWKGKGAILVVDDEPAVRMFAQKTLERFGFEVITAADGHEATGLYEDNHQRIVAVLLDMTMPNMGGVETYQALRAIEPEVRVILSSGYSEQDAAGHFDEDNLAGFIQKPYTSTDLLDIMRASLSL